MALAQAAYRFGSNDGTESTHGFLAALNTPIVRSQSDASTFLLRILVQASGGVAHNNLDFQFQKRKNGGAFANVTTTSADIRAVSTTVFANAQNTTSRLGGTGTFESSSQGCTHDGLSGGNQFDIVANGRGETVCALQLVPADLSGGDLLEFRLLADGALLNSYTVTPSLTVQGTAAGALAVTEPADTFSALGGVLVAGTLSATEASDTFLADGDAEMATYLELRNLGNDSDLRNKTEVAVLVSANAVLRASPAAPDDQVGWAQAVLASPAMWAQRALWIALAQNKDLTVQQITSASDTDLQAAVDAVVPVLAKGMTPGG